MNPVHPYPPPPDIAQLLAEYDKHYYFPLGRLLQQLPGDITNQPRLTPEQAQMCIAVSGFAAHAMATIKSGLVALETLLNNASDCSSNNPPDNIELDIQRLRTYLQAEAGFMQSCHEDYRDAADSIARVT